jgi:transposase
MLATVVFPQVSHLRIEAALRQEEHVVLLVRLTGRTGRCPRCRRRSRRLQSHYDRRLADLPCCGSPVTIQLRVRRFVCWYRRCSQRIFSERLPALMLPYARRTVRATAHLRASGFALGGAPAVRHARRDGLPVSRRTLLRLLRAAPSPAIGTVRVLGVDDFAFRKGRTYGTVLVNLETHRVVDLLPDRTAETFTAWLRAHPGVEVISRDRASAYADGARQGAPDAQQVADRFHVLKNLSDAVERYLSHHHAALRAAARHLDQTAAGSGDEGPPAALAARRPPTRVVQDQQARRARRAACYQDVCDLQRAGLSLREIARRLTIGRDKVRRFVRAGTFPERAPCAPRPTILCPYEPYLRQRWEEGCHNARVLYEELRAQGYVGSAERLRQFLTHWRHAPGRPGPTPRHLPPDTSPAARPPSTPTKSPRQATWLLLRGTEQLDDEERGYLHALLEVYPEAGQVQALAQTFRRLLGEHDLAGLDPWLAAVVRSGITELIGFATGLRRDRAAVEAAFTTEWSQGQVEGHVNRIKTTKRSMYGRSKFDLLRQRILHGVA